MPNEEKKTDVWKWFGYGWTLIWGVITLGVVVTIYDQIYGDFEIIVVSLLILIYCSLQSFMMIYGKASVETAFAHDSEFRKLRKLLKEEANEYENEELQEAKQKMGKTTVKMYINAIFVLIIYVIALWNLFGAL